MKCIEKYEDFEGVRVNEYCEFLYSEVCENCKIKCPHKDSQRTLEEREYEHQGYSA